METYSNKILENGGEESMSSLRVFPVNHSVVPENEMERKMTVTSGRRCFVSSMRLDRLGLLVRTLLESSRWYSPARRLRWGVTRIPREKVTRKRKCVSNLLLTESATISNVSIIRSSQLLYRLVPSGHPTGETEFGSLLPTVAAQDFKRRRPNSKQQGLSEMAYNDMLPTPNASEATKYTKTYNPSSQMGQSLTALAVNGLIEGVSQCQTGKNFQLNPLFVEEMMGFPPDYLVSPFLNGDNNQ